MIFQAQQQFTADKLAAQHGGNALENTVRPPSVIRAHCLAGQANWRLRAEQAQRVLAKVRNPQLYVRASVSTT